MKNTSKLLVIGLLCSIFASSQNLQDAQITYGKVTGTPEFIRFPKDNPLSLQGTSLQQKALNFLQDNAQLFGISSVGDSFRFTTESEDAQGFTHVEFTQVFNAIPVFDGKLKFHFDTNHKLSAVNGNFIPNIKLNPQPVLSGSEANAIALAEVDRQGLNTSGTPLFVNSNKLYVFQKGLVENRDRGQYLVYEVEVRNNNDVREFMYINAYNGSLVEQYTGMAHAINRIVYEVDTSNIVWQEGDAFPGTLSIWQQNEVVVSEHVYNFFNNTFGFLSYDNADATMRTINNNPNISCPNANWNGFSVNYCDGTAADDVIAHEWGHAYTQYTSGLIYSYQAGAINEAYSDIWGETVDLINGYQDTGENLALRTGCGSSLRWRMGEDASAFGSPIRDMWNPPCNGDPGKVTDGIYYCGNGDSGGVHINSGIPNHAYALLVDGGTYNGQTITGIGLTKAAHIFWRAQSVYLTSTSDFGSLADALEAACTDLIGQNLEGLSTAVFAAGPSGEIITTSDFDELVKVLLAVELKLDPDTCGFEPILSATADPCEAAMSNPVFYEDWESGIGSWVATEIPVNPGTWEPRNWTLVSNLPDGRPGQGIFAPNPVNGDCNISLQNGILRLESPEITLPNYPTGSFEMVFSHNISTEAAWDGGNLKYNLNGGGWAVVPSSAFVDNAYNGTINGFLSGNDNPMQGEEAFTGSDEGSSTGSWGRSFIDLSALGAVANSTIQFRWEMGSDGCNGRIGWYLDEISIYNCDEPLSVDEFTSLKESLQVYPNPSNGTFSIKNRQGLELVKADVFDINGRLVQSFNLSSASAQELKLKAVSPGMYFMSIYTRSGKETVKLLVK